MSLTNQQFADAISGLRVNSIDGASRELRSATRIEVNGRVLVWPVDSQGKPGEGRTVLVRDISLNGIGLLSSIHMPHGERFIVGLARPKQKPILVRYTARHTRELADGIYSIGAAYENALESNRTSRAA